VSTDAIDYRGVLEAVERVLNRGGAAPQVLRGVLECLHARGVESGRVLYVEGGVLSEGVSIGGSAARIAAPVVFQGEEVGSLELAVDDSAFAQRVAMLISAYVSAARAGDPAIRPGAPGAHPPSSK
jgi:hypothetical protein